MTDQDKEYMRDLFAGFAMCGLLAHGDKPLERVAETAYAIADAMFVFRGPEETIGLPAIKRKARTK
jgi:hypothetical protein